MKALVSANLLSGNIYLTYTFYVEPFTDVF